MKKIVSICLFFLVVCLSSCLDTKKSVSEVTLLTCENCKETDKEIIKPENIEIVKLETDKSFLIGDVKQMEITDSLIFILDSYQNLYTFNKKGQFVKQISSKGDAPEQYVACTSFYADRENKYLTIVDFIKSRTLNFSYDGKYLTSKKMVSPTNTRWGTKVMPANDGKLLMFHSANPELNCQYSLFSKDDFSFIWQKYPYDPIRPTDHALDFSKHPMTPTNDGVNIIFPLCDTVFQYNNGQITPKYIIELPLPMLDKKNFSEELSVNNSYFSTLFTLTKSNKFFSGFSEIFETNNYILLTCQLQYKSSHYLANKSTKKGIYINKKNDVSEIPLWNIRTSTENEFVGLIDCETLLNFKEEAKDASLIHPKILEIINKSDFDDNPCVVFYRFK